MNQLFFALFGPVAEDDLYKRASHLCFKKYNSLCVVAQ